MLHITFDPGKNERNVLERGLSFELASEFDFETAYVEADSRRAYDERDTSRSAVFTVGYTSCASRKQPMAFASSASGKQTIER